MPSHLYIALFLLCTTTHLTGQVGNNLVPNGSFEQKVACPRDYESMDYYFRPARTVKYWGLPTRGTSDYFHSCGLGNLEPFNGFLWQQPKEGQAYAGVMLFSKNDTTHYDPFYEYREYLCVRLTEPLVADQEYCVSFYTAMARVWEGHSYGSKAIGAYLSEDLVTKIDTTNWMLPANLLPCIPQIRASTIMRDTGVWQLISGTYRATGGEQWLTIGNFDHDSVTLLQSEYRLPQFINDFNPHYVSYFYIDQVSIYPTHEPIFFPDKTKQVCNEAFPAALHTNYEGISSLWSTGDTTANIIIDHPGEYSVIKTYEGCTAYDTITIISVEPLVVDLGPDIINNCIDGIAQPVVLRNIVPLQNNNWSTTPLHLDSLVVNNPRTYSLSSSNACGNVTDEVIVTGCNPSDIYVPNVFKPGIQGENDHFMAFGQNWIFETLQVFDVWGHEVYFETLPDLGWDGNTDGRRCPPGVYIWILTYHSLNNTQLLKKYGDVTLID